MKTMWEQSRLSPADYQRLEQAFFAPPGAKTPQPISKTAKIIMGGVVIFSFGIAALLFFRQFSLIILPQMHNISDNASVSLLAENKLLSAELLNPYGNSQVFKGLIYIALPFGKKSGFSLDFKEKTDMSGANLFLVVKNPHQDFALEAILRDSRFLSNARRPIQVNVASSAEKAAYLQIPIQLPGAELSGVNLFQIKQVRFAFWQQQAETLPLLVKNLYLK